MSNKDKPLPKPPTKAFGRKNNFEQAEQPSLLADRMAVAAAEGKLEEFLKKEMPDNEYARNLASMMMGMAGMVPGGSGMTAPEANTGEQHQEPGEQDTAEVPGDVREAIMGGDLESLMGLLRREHQKRNPNSPLLKSDDAPKAETAQGPASAAQQPAINKELIEALIQIANDNSVTLDWIILRAIKVYVQEFQKTGKL